MTITDLVQLALSKGRKSHDLPDFNTGDTIGVSVRVREGEKERLQQFKGVVLKISGAGQSRSFTVRKISEGIGVERTFPFYSPAIEAVKVYAHGKRIRKSRMFFLRNLKGRAAKVKSDLVAAREQKPSAAKETAE